MTTYTWPLGSGGSGGGGGGSTLIPPPGGSPRKAEEIKKLVPDWVETRFPSLTGAILHALGVEDHRVTVGDRTLFVRGLSPAGNVLFVTVPDDPNIRVSITLPTALSSPLSITVTGKDIAISLQTDGSALQVTTAALLQAAIEASPAASALVDVTTFGTAGGMVGVTSGFYPLDPDGLDGARRDFLLPYARGLALGAIGNNYGIAKPVLLGLSDDQFRQYIAALAFQRKCSRGSIEAILSVIFGDKGSAGWSVYESIRRKTITVEVTEALISTGVQNATYPRAVSTTPSTTTRTGDYLRPNATYAARGAVKISIGGALSSIPNNSVYARTRDSNRPALLNVMKLVRAAGVKLEFVQRKG